MHLMDALKFNGIIHLIGKCSRHVTFTNLNCAITITNSKFSSIIRELQAVNAITVSIITVFDLTLDTAERYCCFLQNGNNKIRRMYIFMYIFINIWFIQWKTKITQFVVRNFIEETATNNIHIIWFIWAKPKQKILSRIFIQDAVISVANDDNTLGSAEYSKIVIINNGPWTLMTYLSECSVLK